MYNEYLELLEANPMFKDINKEELLQLLNCSKPIIKELKPNDFLFMQDDISDYLYIVASGNINVYKENFNGDRHIVGSFNKNEVIGEVIIFSTINNYPVTAIASNNSKVLAFHKDIFYNPCNNSCSFHNKLIRNCLTILSDRALLLNRKIELLTTSSIREKIIKYLSALRGNQKSDYIELPFNREKLAEYLNVTRPSLSRELCKMREDDLIDFDKNIIKVKKKFF